MDFFSHILFSSIFCIVSFCVFATATDDFSVQPKSHQQQFTLIQQNLNGETGSVLLNEDAIGSFFGLSVTGIGDINGDGVDDIAIGTFGPKPVYVVFGKKGWSFASFNVTQLNGANGFMVTSDNTGDMFGYAVSGVGDFNGDKIDDLLIGAPWSNAPVTKAGRVYVLFGRPASSPFPKTFSISSLTQKESVWFSGSTEDEMVGITIGRAGDVNGDGLCDAVIGAEGKAYVVYGQVNASSLSLTELSGMKGYSVKQSGGRIVVSGAGDINNDNLDDVIFGAPHVGPISTGSDSVQDWRGEAYVIFGSKAVPPFESPLNLSAIPSLVGFTLTGLPGGGQFGVSVSSAKDVNGDGVDDIIIGSSVKTSSSLITRAYVMFGMNGNDFPQSFSLSSLNGANGFRMDVEDIGDVDGERPAYYTPTIAVGTIGSINGDQYDDVALGVPYADFTQGDTTLEDVGKIYVLFGKEQFGPVVSLYDINGGGFVIVGGEKNGKAGASLQYIGDFNHDDVDDFILGAPFISGKAQNTPYVGSSYVIFGGERLSHLKTTLVLSRVLGVVFGTAILIISVFVVAYRYRFQMDDSDIRFSRVGQGDGDGEKEEDDDDNDNDILLSDN